MNEFEFNREDAVKYGVNLAVVVGAVKDGGVTTSELRHKLRFWR